MHAFILFMYVVYSQHTPLPLIVLYALPNHLYIVLLISYKIYISYIQLTTDVGTGHHGMALPQVADGGMPSHMESSCE